MRKAICMALLIVMTGSPFSQQTPFVKDDYLQKSKHQKTAAWILLGRGATLSVVGLAVGLNSAVDELGSRIATGEDDKSFVAGAVLFYMGLGSMLGSIPLFVASGRNKRKAMEAALIFKTENSPVMQKTAICSHSYPVLSVKFSLQ
jgi:hypothetical protein